MGGIIFLALFFMTIIAIIMTICALINLDK